MTNHASIINISGKKASPYVSPNALIKKNERVCIMYIRICIWPLVCELGGKSSISVLSVSSMGLCLLYI